MATATIRDPSGRELARYDRRDERRALLTAQGQASYPVWVGEQRDALETRWRCPVGSTIEVDGVPRLRLEADRVWRPVLEVGTGSTSPAVES